MNNEVYNQFEIMNLSANHSASWTRVSPKFWTVIGRESLRLLSQFPGKISLLTGNTRAGRDRQCSTVHLHCIIFKYKLVGIELESGG